MTAPPPEQQPQASQNAETTVGTPTFTRKNLRVWHPIGPIRDYFTEQMRKDDRLNRRY